MIHANDTHVLIDATGTAILSGTQEQIELEALALIAEGIENVSIRTIDDMPVWNWTMIDWEE